jgi:putative ABC transport system permease protein
MEVIMLRNYLTIAVRNLLRHKGYSAINIAGLAIGMTCCILIFLLIQNELSYDRFHKKADRIYRVIQERRSQGGTTSFDIGTPGALGPALRVYFPEVQETVRTWLQVVPVEYEGKTLDSQICLADKSLFDVFTFPFVKGESQTAFTNPSAAVITEDMSRRLFGDADPIGKVLAVHQFNFPGQFIVTGVLKTPPDNSTIQFDFLVIDPNRSEETRLRWQEWLPTESWRPVTTYVLLPEGYDPKKLEQKLPDFAAPYLGPKAAPNTTYHLQPLTRIHLYSQQDYGINRYGDIGQVYLLSAIAAFILLIACINFMNLSTARSASRAKEVGIRKVVGAYRRQLIRQFLGESVLLAFLAMLMAMGLAELTLPAFNTLIGRPLPPDANSYIALLPGLIGVTLLTGLLAGCYPAFCLSAYQPVETLKGILRSGTKGAQFRKALVVFQFAISVFLIISTFVIHDQITYMLNKNLGFDTEHVVLLPIFAQDQQMVEDLDKRLSARYKMVKQEFLKHPGVLNASAFRFMPVIGGGGMVRSIQPEGAQGTSWQIPVEEVDESFFDTFGIKLVSGRTFSPGVRSSFAPEFIINETAAKQFGWTDPIGKKITWVDHGFGTIIGVVKDYHFAPLNQRIGPMIFMTRTGLFAWLGLKVRGNGLPETIRFLEKTWKRFVPDQPFVCRFLDETLNQMYQSERRLRRISGVSSALAILVACLGLFGLAAFSAEQRTKEVGIRKVLGASIANIVLLLSRDFVKFVAVANLIAWPVAYYVMNGWLQNFAYRVGLGIWTFVLGGILVLIIALVTVSVQAVKAARANPVDALRYE